MKDLVRRSTSGFIYVVLFLGAAFWSKESYLALTSVFGFICLWEFSKLVSTNNIIAYILFALMSVLLLMGETDFSAIPFFLALAFTGSFQLIYHLYSENTSYPKNNFQKQDITIRYLVFSYLFLLLLPFDGDDYKPLILIATLVLIWANDSFAYLVGVNFGKRKLFEKISPKKTIEGFVGGIIFTIISGILLFYATEMYRILDWVALAIIVSVFGTLGDLIESKFKRRAKIKDSGKIMPGHGGLLDRMDSLLFVAPFVYLYIYFII